MSRRSKFSFSKPLNLNVYKLTFKAHLDVKYDRTRDLLWKSSWLLGGICFFPVIGFGIFLGACIMRNACLRAFWLKDYSIQCKNVVDSATSSTGRRYKIRCNSYWKPTDDEKEIVDQFYRNRRLAGIFWITLIFHGIVIITVTAIVLITFCSKGFLICSK